MSRDPDPDSIESLLKDLDGLAETLDKSGEVPTEESLRALARLASTSISPSSASTGTKRFLKLRPAVVLAGAALLLIGTTLGWFAFFSPDPQPTPKDLLASLPDDAARESFSRIDTLSDAAKKVVVQATIRLRVSRDQRWLIHPRATVSDSRLCFRFMLRPMGPNDPSYHYVVRVVDALTGREMAVERFWISQEQDRGYVLGPASRGSTQGSALFDLDLELPRILGVEDGNPLLESCFAQGQILPRDRDYQWSVSLDSEHHPDLAQHFSPPPVDFRAVSEGVREAVLSMQKTGNAALDCLLRAATFNSRFMAFDCLAVLEELPARATKEQARFARLLQCEALLLLKDGKATSVAYTLLPDEEP